MNNNRNSSIAEMIANDIISVQPMPSDCIQKMIEASCSTKELIEAGYEPVSEIGLMWRKKDV